MSHYPSSGAQKILKHPSIEVTSFAFRLPPPELIQKSEAAIDEVGCIILDDMKQVVGMQTLSLDTGKHHMSLRLNNLLKSKIWDEKIALWAKLGICYLSDEHQEPPKNQVGLFIKRDAEGLPIHLKVLLCSTLTSPSIDCNLDDFDRKIELLNKHNLTYFRHIDSVMSDIGSIANQFVRADDDTRNSLADGFNAKWNSELTLSFITDPPTQAGALKVTDASGEILYRSSFTPASRSLPSNFSEFMVKPGQTRSEVGSKSHIGLIPSHSTAGKLSSVEPNEIKPLGADKNPSTQMLLTWSRRSPIRPLAIGAAALLIGSTIYGLRKNTMK